MQVRNIGIFSHVDAGKTTVTENLLFLSGSIKKIGKVDDGTTQTDFLDVEKQRGITVRSAQTYFLYDDIKFNLIDTPGHTDFVADVERILPIIDAAILIISAAEGVQANTEIIWKALKQRNIPVLFFVNKIDRMGVNIHELLSEIRTELTDKFISLQDVIDEGTNEANIIDFADRGEYPDFFIEEIANYDDLLLEKYLNSEQIKNSEIQESIKQLTFSSNIIPLIYGSAKTSLGIKKLLFCMKNYFPSPISKPIDSLFSALVYSIIYDKTLGKTANIRIYSGKVKNKDIIKNCTSDKDEKINIIRKNFAGKYIYLSFAEAGDIVNISGLSKVQVGDILGNINKDIPSIIKLQIPLLTVQVKPLENKDYTPLLEALKVLSEEDPSLDFYHIPEEKELHIKITGWIQIEVLEQIISDRFNIKAKCDTPTVIYKETPSKSGVGYVRYWMPKPCWAIMKFKIEPGERGSGVQYESIISVDDIKQRYQNEVVRILPEALKQGIKGWQVTDIKITLIEGEDHILHSRAGDFATATPMGIMNGLNQIGTDLLEPILSYEITASEDLLGTIISDITQMRGSFDSPKIEDGKVMVNGLLPLATSLDYPIKITSRSGGKAKIKTRFHSYARCTDEQGIIREYKGINPLDTAKFILKARRAIQ